MVDSFFVNIQLLSYLSCFGAFLLLAVLVGLSRTGGAHKYLLLACCVATVIWSGVVVAVPWIGPFPKILAAAEILRNLLWLTMLGTLLGIRRFDKSGLTARLAVLTVVVVSLTLLYVGSFAEIIPTPLSSLANLQTIVGGGHVFLSVIGLLAIENLYRNSSVKLRWAIKYFCFGLGTILVYDFFLYADGVLFGQLDQEFFNVRGFANAIIVPLLAISVSRAALWDIDIHISRTAVFHTTALIGSGVYLIGMAGIGFYVREIGGEWGRVIQNLLLATTVLFLFIIFSSAAMRAKFKVWISKHFFSYKYDYREEWLRFIRTITSTEGPAGLHERIVRSVGDIVDCSSGGLWVLRDGDNAFLPTVTMQLGDRPPAQSLDSPLVRFLSDTHWIVDLEEYRRNPSRYGDIEVPAWLLENRSVWLIVPLIYRDSMQAFLVLGRPRASRDLGWEDYDLLRTVGNQAASYLAEEQAMNELSDARRLDDFNRRSAFIIHDIKNVVSQMSLMIQNAEKFGDNPEFQKDMIATVGNSVTRMKDLLERFKTVQQPASETVGESVQAPELAPLMKVVHEVAANWCKQKPDLLVDLPDTTGLLVDHSRLTSVLDHLLQNAIEAAGVNGSVALRQRVHGREVFIEVDDDGPGMDSGYIKNRLFRPLDSQKSSGYGLGAYQTRQLVREMGGRLEVLSEVGRGTVMRVVLPLREGSGVA